jgi:hypothetical protein
MDHSVTLLSGQRALIERLERWMARLRPAARGAAA